MMGILFPGHLAFNYGMVAGSVIIAVVASILAFWTLFRLLSIYPQKEILRIACAVFLAGAKSGVHFLGMKSAYYMYTPLQHGQPWVTSISAAVAYKVALITTLCFILVLMAIIMADLRAWLYGFASKLNLADDLIAKIQTCKPADQPALMTRCRNNRKIT